MSLSARARVELSGAEASQVCSVSQLPIGTQACVICGALLPHAPLDAHLEAAVCTRAPFRTGTRGADANYTQHQRGFAPRPQMPAPIRCGILASAGAPWQSLSRPRARAHMRAGTATGTTKAPHTHTATHSGIALFLSPDTNSPRRMHGSLCNCSFRPRFSTTPQKGTHLTRV